jgi:hypothetical protein
VPHLTHLINPFNTDDPHFNFTFRSMATALQHAASHGVLVEVLGITFADEAVAVPTDALAAAPPHTLRILPVLDPARTAGAYLKQEGLLFGTEEKPLKTPLVADVFQAGYEHAASGTLVWTNFDLIVAPDFYTTIMSQLSGGVLQFGAVGAGTAGAASGVGESAAPAPPPPTGLPKPGFSVLRLDVMIEKSKHPDLSSWSVRNMQYTMSFHAPEPITPNNLSLINQ